MRIKSLRGVGRPSAGVARTDVDLDRVTVALRRRVGVLQLIRVAGVGWQVGHLDPASVFVWGGRGVRVSRGAADDLLHGDVFDRAVEEVVHVA